MARGSNGSMLRINLLLMLLGAVAGALAAIPLTWLGKVISGAPDPATLANYLWNMRVFAVMGALFAPVLAWSSLRRVPLWRAALEPTAGGLIGMVLGIWIGTLIGSEALMLFLSAGGIGAACWRLNRSYSHKSLIGAEGRTELHSAEPLKLN